MPFRILHISDLHERAEFPNMKVSRRRILEQDQEERGLVLGPKFHEALREMARMSIDLVLFTGDLADWGKPQEYDQATHRIARILDVLGLPRSAFWAVPGNHDVNQAIKKDKWKESTKWFAEMPDADRLGRWYRKTTRQPERLSSKPGDITKRTQAFWDWFESFRGESVNRKFLGYRHTFLPGSLRSTMPIHLIGLDSGWFCGGKEEFVVVTPNQVQAVLSENGNGLDGFKIAMVHHPPNLLVDADEVKRLLIEHKVSLLLHGHQHEPTMLQETTPDGSLRVLATGCLMEGELGKAWPNGFQVIEVDPEQARYRIHLRKWSRKANFWAVGSDLYQNAPQGVISLGWPKEEAGTVVAELAEESWYNLLVAEGVRLVEKDGQHRLRMVREGSSILADLNGNSRLLPDLASAVGWVQEVILQECAQEKLSVGIRIAEYLGEHRSPCPEIFRLPVDEIVRLDRLLQLVSRVKAEAVLIPQCSPSTAVRAGFYAKRVAYSRVGVAKDGELFWLENTKSGSEKIASYLEDIENPDRLIVMISIAQNVEPAVRKWLQGQPSRVVSVRPKEGISREALNPIADTAGWAIFIGDLIRKYRIINRETVLFMAAPNILSVAVGRELNAVGKIIVMKHIKEQDTYEQDFTLDT